MPTHCQADRVLECKLLFLHCAGTSQLRLSVCKGGPMQLQVAKEKVEAMRAERDAFAERLRHVEAVTLQQDTSAVEELQVSGNNKLFDQPKGVLPTLPAALLPGSV